MILFWINKKPPLYLETHKKIKNYIPSIISLCHTGDNVQIVWVTLIYFFIKILLCKCSFFIMTLWLNYVRFQSFRTLAIICRWSMFHTSILKSHKQIFKYRQYYSQTHLEIKPQYEQLLGASVVLHMSPVCKGKTSLSKSHGCARP